MKRVAALILLAVLCGNDAQAALDPFTVRDIRVEGLARISPGTVFANLPVEKGDRIDKERAASAIRALFKTGFFSDVQLDRQGDILVVKVVERPAISKITITGNKDLKEEDLLKGLKEIGLSEGETFDRLALDRVTQELTRQYNNRGKYNVSIKPKVTDLDRNRVEIAITVAEGKAAKIKHISVVGNQKFSEGEIREDFESNATNWLSWYKSDDQYSKEKLSGDLEKLTSFYQDRGYVDFSAESTQVTISPDKRAIYLTLNVREGEIYKLSDVKLTGELILEESSLTPLIVAKSGEIYSRKKLEESAEAITKVLANIGYAFAEVTPVPQIDREKREVAVTLLVTPGKRVYVRRVNFVGNAQTQDEVLRREMRQLEGAWFSQAAIDRSKIRLQRLGFFKKVDIDTPRVPGSDDLVDVNVKVEEQSAGAFQFGLGYSQLQGLLTSVSVSERNFLGTGNTIGVTVQNNSIYKRFDFNYFDPYFTEDGISAGYNAYYRELDQGQANVANYSTDSAGGSFSTSIPLTETNSLSASLGIDRTKITTIDGSTPPSLIQSLVDELGDRARFPCITSTNNNTTPPTTETHCGPYRRWVVNTWRLSVGFASDSRNKYFAPTRGGYTRIAADIALPGSRAEYYKLYAQEARYFPLNSFLTLLLSADLGYGNGYGKTKDLPFYENFYAGGVNSVRGYRDNTLGPCEKLSEQSTYCQPLGGSFRTTGTAEIIFPTPFAKRGDDSSQFSAFLDVGNVFKDIDAFKASELRASVGVSFKWQAPVGPIKISLSVPLRDQKDDRTETLQFAFGNAF